jgi:hypothetical protein
LGAAARPSTAAQTGRSRDATSTAQADDLGSVFGVREAARVRAILQRDAERLAQEPRRRPLSRAYRGSSDPVEPLTAESVARESARAVRVELQRTVGGAELEGIVSRLGTSRMGALLLREVEAALRARLSVDRDFDPERFPNASSRFGPAS